jgi:hypothetical protein
MLVAIKAKITAKRSEPGITKLGSEKSMPVFGAEGSGVGVVVVAPVEHPSW